MAALVIFLVAGFVHILEQRFSQGDIYPHYASYRNDPLGTSVLYETLERLPGVSVSRNRTDLNLIGDLDHDSVLLLLGFPRDEIEDLRTPTGDPVIDAIKAGARLVIAINPQQVPVAFRRDRSSEEEDWFERRRKLQEQHDKRDRTGKKSKEEIAERKKKEKEEREKLEKEEEAARGQRLTDLLGFELESAIYAERPESGWETEAGKDLPAAIVEELPDWFSQYRLAIEAEKTGGREILRVGKEPVVLEYPHGKGTIVITTDSHFISNENLHRGAQPGFLLWMLGGKSRVIFDETIHGTVETGGAMKLMRRYRIHGVFFGLIVFFVLWAWRGAVPLVPGSDDADRGLVDTTGTVLGEESGSGLVRLLRRSIPAGNLIAQCVEIWKNAQTARIAPAVEQKIGAIVERQRDDAKHFAPADAYRAIAEIVRKR